MLAAQVVAAIIITCWAAQGSTGTGPGYPRAGVFALTRVFYARRVRLVGTWVGYGLGLRSRRNAQVRPGGPSYPHRLGGQCGLGLASGFAGRAGNGTGGGSLRIAYPGSFIWGMLFPFGWRLGPALMESNICSNPFESVLLNSSWTKSLAQAITSGCAPVARPMTIPAASST